MKFKYILLKTCFKTADFMEKATREQQLDWDTTERSYV